MCLLAGGEVPVLPPPEEEDAIIPLSPPLALAPFPGGFPPEPAPGPFGGEDPPIALGGPPPKCGDDPPIPAGSPPNLPMAFGLSAFSLAVRLSVGGLKFISGTLPNLGPSLGLDIPGILFITGFPMSGAFTAGIPGDADGVFAGEDGDGEEAAGGSFGALPVDEVFEVFFVLHPPAVVQLYEEAQVVVVVVYHKFWRSIGSIRFCSIASIRFYSRTTNGWSPTETS